MYKLSLYASLTLAMFTTSSFSNEDIKKLDDIVVTSKSNQSIEDLSNTITIITAEDIEKLNATDIKDILLKSAGMVEIGEEEALEELTFLLGEQDNLMHFF